MEKERKTSDFFIMPELFNLFSLLKVVQEFLINGSMPF